MKRLRTLQPGQLVMLAYYCGIVVALFALVAVLAAERADRQRAENVRERQQMLDVMLAQHKQLSAIQAAQQQQQAAAPAAGGSTHEPDPSA